MEKGVVRKIDKLGRVVLPAEWRKALLLKNHTPLEMMFQNGEISIKKYERSCSFCNSSSDLISYKGRRVCRECASKIGLIAKI